MTLFDDVSFVIRAKNRKTVFEKLTKPMTPTEISKELGLNIGFVSNILIELKKRKLIDCLSPNEKRHRFYKITKKGEQVLEATKKIGNS
ncbi:ArsR family transcriptional regulator [archaeon]|nr:ArsR family transcriptional regulator [archaeon]